MRTMILLAALTLAFTTGCGDGVDDAGAEPTPTPTPVEIPQCVPRIDPEQSIGCLMSDVAAVTFGPDALCCETNAVPRVECSGRYCSVCCD